MQVLHEGLADSKYRPCPAAGEYVEAGWLGRKSQRGFYDYRGDNLCRRADTAWRPDFVNPLRVACAPSVAEIIGHGYECRREPGRHAGRQCPPADRRHVLKMNLQSRPTC